MHAVEAGLLFLLVSFIARRGRDGTFAYIFAAFTAIGALLYTIGNGLSGEAPYAWALAVGLLAVGYTRNRFRSRTGRPNRT